MQENIIALVANDEKHAPLVRGSVELGMFGGPYRVLAARIYDYWDKYKKPPGDHLPDIMSDKLEGDSKEAELYTDIVASVLSVKADLNTEYVLNQLEMFVQRQSLKSVAQDLVRALQRNTDEGLEEAKELIANANKKTLTVFDPGLRLSDQDNALKFLNRNDHDTLPLGIPELDKRRFGPTRKELWLLVGNTKAGKTFSLVHLGKMASRHGFKVAHVSLEMGRDNVAKRYLQTYFGMANRPDPIKTVDFKKDADNHIVGFTEKEVHPKLHLDDPAIKSKLRRRLTRWGPGVLENVFVKDFPTGQLSIPQLRAYLDSLEATQQFAPDLLIVDYPDLMKINGADYRLGIDQIFKDLRGLAGERNMAVAVVSQSHRGAAKAKLVGADNVSEAYSKIAHADVVLTYTSTDEERQLGLARLYVAAGRNDEDRLTIILSQQYALGVFARDSGLMGKEYWDAFGGESDG